jgi:hypothetical protein
MTSQSPQPAHSYSGVHSGFEPLVPLARMPFFADAEEMGLQVDQSGSALSRRIRYRNWVSSDPSGALGPKQSSAWMHDRETGAGMIDEPPGSGISRSAI